MPENSERDIRIHGNVEKLTQIEKVEGNVIIQRSSKVNAPALLKRGIQLMKIHSYEQAIATFKEVIDDDPLLADAYYYLALASLKGKRPRTLTLTQIRDIEHNLRSAYEIDSSKAHYLYLWALVKHDFYVTNGFLVRPPMVATLLSAAQQCVYDHAFVLEMLAHVSGVDGQIIKIILGGSP